MEIILDALGCERGVSTAVEAGLLASHKLNISVSFSGDQTQIENAIHSHGAEHGNYRIIHTIEKIEMGESVSHFTDLKVGASVVKAFQELKEGRADALVSAGHTGATVLCAREYAGLMPQVRKPALCQSLPTATGRQFLLLDVGAGVSVTPNDLVMYAILGDAAYRVFFNESKPRVGLLNIGRESGKGNPRLRKAESLMRGKNINFVGNIEGNQVWKNMADVIVTDGITGNIVLKSAEGLFQMLIDTLKSKNILNEKHVENAANLLYSENYYGGAPLLGVMRNCIVCHGQADSHEIYHAIKLAKWCVENRFCEVVQRMICDIMAFRGN